MLRCEQSSTGVRGSISIKSDIQKSDLDQSRALRIASNPRLLLFGDRGSTRCIHG